ncbi:MAG: substrate-binding domain-containing protein [Candidatus Omnitrophica bacterium]|nr:substrate-binding domain-containing protein [Candidatus Omnitrophota bacterium]
MKRMKTFSLLCAAVAGMALTIFVIGCAKHDADESAKTDKRVIAVIPKGTAHVFWQSVHAGALTAGKELGVEIAWNGPQTETMKDQQIAITQDFVVRKVDGIVLAPQDQNALVKVVEQIADARIPCVIFDSGINSDKYVSFVATDNNQGGVKASKELGRLLNGKGTCIITRCDPGSDSTNQREKGFEDTLAKEFPDIQIIDSQYGYSDKDKSRSVTEDMLTAHPNVDAIFASNESSAHGALMALRGLNLAGKKIFVGFDSSVDLLEGLNNKEIHALVIQNPFNMGYQSVKSIVSYLDGLDVERRIDTGVYLITPGNINDPEMQKVLNPDLSILNEE